MIFLTFLENAFKHGQQTPESSYEIEGNIEVEKDHLTFRLKNDNGSNGQNIESINGVGLENTKRRLELLYPNRHQLNINKSDQSFSVDLTIQINED